MVKTKKIRIEQAKGRAATKLQQPVKQAVAPDSDLLESWSAEIQALQGKKFSNLDQALDYFAELALKKLDPGVEVSQPEKEFVRDMLATDPVLVEALQGLLSGVD